MHWLTKSIISMVLFCPFLIYSNFAARNFQMRGDVMMMYWLLFSAIGMFGFIADDDPVVLMPNIHIFIIIFGGVIIGAGSNIFLIKAVTDKLCPNPGIPVAILGISSVVIYVITPVFALVFPKCFSHIRFNIWTFIGICMTVGGVFIIFLKQK